MHALFPFHFVVVRDFKFFVKFFRFFIVLNRVVAMMRFILWDEVRSLAGDTIIIGPTKYFRQILPPITMFWRGVRRLPFKGVAFPWIAARVFSIAQA